MMRSSSPRDAAGLHLHCADGCKDAPPVVQLGCHHAVRRSYEIAQGSQYRRFGFRPMDECNRCQLRRLASGHAELDTPAEGMLVAIPWRRQTSATLTPGFSVSCTIACFCASLKRRRFDRPSTAVSSDIGAVRN
ncbi:hypothetical protein NKI48_31790 [Mesorhizobium sp. M0644]|uniref:hypothetical protein n=1 Tax=Mesorhizobium sp. LSJC280B00 TaxID=1287336 RepID=UPI001FD9F8A7|nr:hypothetical protein [Mesorhizobium sp. LSJC280B00]